MVYGEKRKCRLSSSKETKIGLDGKMLSSEYF